MNDGVKGSKAGRYGSIQVKRIARFRIDIWHRAFLDEERFLAGTGHKFGCDQGTEVVSDNDHIVAFLMTAGKLPDE